MRFRFAPLALLAVAGLAATAAAESKGIFGGVLQPITGENQFVMPVTSPYYHENSLITTDVRGWFVYHQFPDSSLPGTNASDYAVQLRVALTDSLQLVAYKDGYLDINGVTSTEGWNDMAAGLKWQFLRNDEQHLYAAAGVGYEFRTGESAALQNDAEVRGWLSVDKGWGNFHAGATVNVRVNTTSQESGNGNCNFFDWHLRADYKVNDWFSPVVEMNGYHTWNAANGGLPLNGADVINVGANGAKATVDLGMGVEFRAGGCTAIRFAYEFPLTNNNSDIYGTRITCSLIYFF